MAGEGESPSDIRERILASVRQGDEPNNGSFQTESPDDEVGTDQLSLREMILKGLYEEGSLPSTTRPDEVDGEIPYLAKKGIPLSN
jgi:hypothetical protein